MKHFLLILFSTAAMAAEPDWPAIEQRAVDFLQRYIRIESIHPPADTREAAKLFQIEAFRAAGLSFELTNVPEPEK